MSFNLKLDPVTHDLIIGAGFERVEGAEYVIQLVKTRLLTFLGEWELDPSLGLPWFEFGSLELAQAQGVIADVIKSTPGVQALTSINVSREGRDLYVNFTARTIYGTDGSSTISMGIY